MASARLLVIAPDPDLRRSIEFVMEAEDYTVTACASIGETNLVPERFDCTILDHSAATGPVEDIVAFCQRAYPVVLLASADLPLRIGPVFRLVLKPLLGEPLSAAVRDALTARH